MDHGGCVIVCVAPADGVGYHAQTQQPVHVTPAHAFIQSVLQQAAGDVYLLSQLHKEHGHTGVLADGQVLGVGQAVVLRQIAQNSAAHLGLFALPGSVKGAAHVGGQETVGVDAQVFYYQYDLFTVDFAHDALTLLSVFRR